MAYSEQKMEEAVLALLAALSFQNGRSWKTYDFDIMDRLFDKGYITDPHNRNKSVYLTEEGEALGAELAARLFSPDADSG